MRTQWHPLFAHLLGLLLDRYYEVQTEVPVSDLPRCSDILLVRRHGAEAAPFQGLWSNLTDWNVLEFKGPTDAAEEDDLERLIHVGTGLTYRFNEERRAHGEERLDSGQVSFWYLVPALGETFLGQARSRTYLDYQTEGLWRGRVWGHPVWLLSYKDVPVQEDTIPLHLLDREPAAPRALGELVVQRQELWQRFAIWLYTLQPLLWKEIRSMAGSTGLIDWAAVDQVGNLDEVIRFLPPERVIQALGAENLLKELLTRIPPERVAELLRGQQKG